VVQAKPRLLRTERELKERGCLVELLDGDVSKTNLSKGLGYSREDRETNISSALVLWQSTQPQ